jgi:hypothetical protein
VERTLRYAVLAYGARWQRLAVASWALWCILIVQEVEEVTEAVGGAVSSWWAKRPIHHKSL